MIRFAWLQARTQTMIAAAALAAVAVALIITGSDLTHLYGTMIAPCAANGSCSDTTLSNFLNHYDSLRIWLSVLVLVVPGLLGVFWGAPLVARELETGTYRLAWTQSLSRTRWLAVKLAIALVASMVVAGLFSLMVTLWSHPLDRVRSDAFALFEVRNVVPVGYAAFAFVLGVAAGVIIRRTLPAIATVLVAFTAIRLATNGWLRSRLLAPAHLTSVLGADGMGFGSTDGGPLTLRANPPRLPNAWIYSTRIVDDAGHTLTSQTVASSCQQLGTALPAPAPVPPGGLTRSQVPNNARDALNDCIHNLATSYHTLTTYQPANRHWTLQWLELVIYLGAAVVLAGGCIWWVRRRLA